MTAPIPDPTPVGDPPAAPPVTSPDLIDDPSTGRAGRALYEGQAHGGPLDGQAVVSRFPKGVVAIDKPNGRAWIYDYKPEVPAGDAPAQMAEFVCRDEAGMTLDEEAAWVAAEGADYDVVAVG